MMVRTHALFVFCFASAVLAGAWAFELIGGYQPCALCLQQRLPYYIGIPVALLLVLNNPLSRPVTLRRLLFLALVLIFAVSLFLAIRHAGVEWKWWLGPAGCGATNLSSPILPLGNADADPNLIPVFCNEAALRILGLSFAGWNAVASFLLLLAALAGLIRTLGDQTK